MSWSEYAMKQYHHIFLSLGILLLVASTILSSEQKDEKSKNATNLNIGGLIFVGIFLIRYLTDNVSKTN